MSSITRAEAEWRDHTYLNTKAISTLAPIFTVNDDITAVMTSFDANVIPRITNIRYYVEPGGYC